MSRVDQTLDHLNEIVDEMLKSCVEPIAKVGVLYYDISGSVISDYCDSDEQEEQIRHKISAIYGINFLPLGKHPTLGTIAIAILLKQWEKEWKERK